MKKLELYLDMDGVFVNFEKGVRDLCGFDFSTTTDKGLIWKKINKAATFWAQLEWLPDGPELWNTIRANQQQFHSIQMLTGWPVGDQKGIREKTEWVHREMRKMPVIVTKRKDKAQYADSNSILIDDHPENIEMWTQNGGIGILHVNALQTTAELQRILVDHAKNQLTDRL